MAFVRMSSAQLRDRVASGIYALAQRLGKRGRVTTVVIDGKAAAGKSWFARELEDSLDQLHVPFCTIEADWYLLSRSERQRKERTRLREIAGHVYVPADLHLSYWRWPDLTKAVAGVKAKAAAGVKAKTVASVKARARKGGGKILLEKLYDRRTGDCTLTKPLSVRSGKAFVLIVEGSYLLARKDIDADVSILLYVNGEIGRARKIQREEEKQEGEFPTGERVGTVITTWEQIEEPTFFRHLIDHGKKAHVVVDTSDIMSMSVMKLRFPGQAEDDLEKALHWDSRVHEAEAAGDADALLKLVKDAPGDRDAARPAMLAGEFLKRQKQFSRALRAFNLVLERAPHDMRAATQKALMLERLGRSRQALKALDLARTLLESHVAPPQWRAEAEGIRGRVQKHLWRKAWCGKKTLAGRRKGACDAIDDLRDSLLVYEAMFRGDPTSYHNGDNAAALACLHKHLTGRWPDLAGHWKTPEELLPATRWAARAALVTQPDDFWARTTLGNVAIMESMGPTACDEYRRALSECRHDGFSVDSVAQQLELFRSLGYQAAACASALQVLKPHRRDR